MSSDPTFEWKDAVTLLNQKEYTPRCRWGSAHCVIDDKLFISGGCRKESDGGYTHLKDAWMLRRGRDEEELIWEEVQNIPKDFTERCQHTATLVGNCVWIIGGQVLGPPLDEVFTYNIDTKEWRKQNIINASAVKRAGHCAIVSPREPEKILLYGGSFPDNTYTESTPELAIFDTKTLTVVPLAKDPITRGPRSCCIPLHVRGSKVLFFGGGDFSHAVGSGGSCFDTDKRLWTEKFVDCPHLNGLMGAKGTVYNNKVYIYGGIHIGQQRVYSSVLLEITMDQNGNPSNIEHFKSSNLAGRAHHVLFRIGHFLYLLQGRELGDALHTKVYYLDLRTLQNPPRIDQRDQNPNSSDQLSTRVEGRNLLITVPLEKTGLVLGEGCKELEESLKKKDAELKEANEKQFVSQNQVEALRTENLRLKSDLSNKELEIKRLSDSVEKYKEYFSTISKTLSRASSLSEFDGNGDGHQAKKQRS